MKGYSSFGVMIDMSRNAVMTVPALKSFITRLKRYGYNTVMLYTEDTYEVEGLPYFGYLRGRYTQDELAEIDAFCESVGVELIPCIQTLAHLNAYVRWGKCRFDIDDILLADDGSTYELIDKFISTARESFRSKRIHIGMDEAWKLGRGKHLDEFGLEKPSEIMKRHLDRVIQICRKYGFEPLIWSDMLFRSWNDNAYYIVKTDMPEDIKSSLPSGVSAVYWDYYHINEESYDDMLFNHKQLTRDVWFAGGAWSWSGMVPHNSYTLKTMLPALRSAKKHKVKNVFFTLWGDDGGECSHFSQLPALFYLAEYAKGNTDEELIKAKFKRMFGIDFDDFMKLDLPNRIGGVSGRENPSKYMLYCDPFVGYLDYTVKEGAGECYKQYASELYEVAKKSRKYGYLFRTEALLCEVLYLKYELGSRTRRAYKSGDRQELLRLANEDYSRLPALIRSLYKSYRAQWLRENKAFGFEIQDIRLGGLAHRIESCRGRLCDYLNGKIEGIEELEAEILPASAKPEGVPISFNSYTKTVSTAVF